MRGAVLTRFFFGVLFLGAAARIFSGTLGDFKKNTEKEQAENRERRATQTPPQQYIPQQAPPVQQHYQPQYPHYPTYYRPTPDAASANRDSASYRSGPESAPALPEDDRPKCDVLCRMFSALFGAIADAWLDHHTSIYYDKYPYGGDAEAWATLRPPEKITRVVTEVKELPAEKDSDLEEQLIEDGKETIMFPGRNGKYEFKEIPKYRVRHVTKKQAGKKNPETVTEKREVTETVKPPGKRNFVNLEAVGVYSDAETYAFGGAFQTRFAGIIGLIGEYRQFRDQTDKLILGGFGAELAFIQSGGFSWSFYGQFNGFSGVLYLSGVGYGMRMQWFPGGRFGVDLRLGKMEMTDISFWDFTGRLGVFIGAVQVFAGYRIIESNLAHLKGYEAGIQLWF